MLWAPEGTDLRPEGTGLRPLDEVTPEPSARRREKAAFCRVIRGTKGNSSLGPAPNTSPQGFPTQRNYTKVRREKSSRIKGR